MKLKTLAICAALIAIAACSNEKTKSESNTESEVKAETYTMPDSATAMKKWQEYATPGKEHEWMAKSAGTWHTEITMWHYPGAPAETVTGTTQNEMIFGGRYQVSTHTAMMMGMPFEGRSTLAYDNMKKTYISTWIDNMGTGMMVSEGKWDDASKTITLTGKMVDPTIDKETSVREVFKPVDDNTQTFEMYRPGPDGKEYKCMEIKYTRK
ncbi:MAG TPA: DUF1579 domain-containing protein [Chitinophagaceae bacterium]|nr:DUF1579 domain-containing protein [Chitinophagaceae bacterium]